MTRRLSPKVDRQILLVLVAVTLVGVLVGGLSAGFHFAVAGLRGFMATLARESAAIAGVGWLLPSLFGGLATAAAYGLVGRLAPEAGGSGVHEIEGALTGLRPLRWQRVLPVKFVGAWLALGSGLALGREGPTVQMGGSVGAMTARLFRLAADGRHVLIAAGAAAGLAAAFNAPLSGALFILEEMRPHFRFSLFSFQAVLVAAVGADVVTRAVIGPEPMIAGIAYTPPSLPSLLLFLVYGVLIAFVATAFSRSLVGLLELLDRVGPAARVAFALAMGALVGALGVVEPASVGGGYETIARTIRMDFALGALVLLFFVRFGVTIASYGTGVPGGIFAPILALGTLFGMSFGIALQAIVPDSVAHPGLFAAAGMGAFFAATVRTPLTGIALTVELTGDLQLVLPLLVTCLGATLMAEWLGTRPIYEVLLERAVQRSDPPPA